MKKLYKLSWNEVHTATVYADDERDAERLVMGNVTHERPDCCEQIQKFEPRIEEVRDEAL